jgi:hypothetical protein
MKRSKQTTLTAFLFTAFLAIGAALAVLPGCGDDSGNDSQRDALR